LNRVIPLLAFSILILVPLVAQESFSDSTPTCPANHFFNPVSNLCELIVTPQSNLCTIGSFGTTSDQCETAPTCFIGFYDSTSGSCNIGPIPFFGGCIFGTENPTFGICDAPPSCVFGGTFSAAFNACLLSPVCQFGGTFNPAADACLDPSTNSAPICPVDEPFNPTSDLCETQASSPLVGGEIIPIQTTSLILAGTQTFSWMIPVVLSVLGIGLFVVSRKSE